MEKKRGHVRFSGLSGTWYTVDSHCTPYGIYYLWKREQRAEYIRAVLTDEHLTVIDYDCDSDILTALFDNGILTDETEQEDRNMMDEMDELLLLAGLEY